MPVRTMAIQKAGVKAASPSWVTLGCSMAPRPDAIRFLISGCGTRWRSLSPPLLRAIALSLPLDEPSYRGPSPPSRENLLVPRWNFLTSRGVLVGIGEVKKSVEQIAPEMQPVHSSALDEVTGTT